MEVNGLITDCCRWFVRLQYSKACRFKSWHVQKCQTVDHIEHLAASQLYTCGVDYANSAFDHLHAECLQSNCWLAACNMSSITVNDSSVYSGYDGNWQYWCYPFLCCKIELTSDVWYKLAPLSLCYAAPCEYNVVCLRWSQTTNINPLTGNRAANWQLSGKRR